jgi:magnesium transporter
MKTGIVQHSKNRIMWLMVLMISAIITGFIMESYEDAIAVIPALMIFVPMLMDTAGNSGCQTSALIIRGLALGEIHPKDVLKSLWIEVRVGVLCGVALGLVNFLRIMIFNQGDYMLGITVSLSMIATVIIAKSVGCFLPLLAKKLRIDPAMMAAPLITTIADGLALLVYFRLAVLFMNIPV